MRRGKLAASAVERGRNFPKSLRESLDGAPRELASLGRAGLELESTRVFVGRETVRTSGVSTIGSLAHLVRDLKPHFADDSLRDQAHRLAAKGLLVSCPLVSIPAAIQPEQRCNRRRRFLRPAR